MTKLLLLCLLLTSQLSAITIIKGKVIKVADGDTITVIDAYSKEHIIDLKYVDAPELKQKFGLKSKQYLSKLLFGQKVLVQIPEKDQVKSAYVLLNGKSINRDMVFNGYACYAQGKTPHKSYQSAQRRASKLKIGLWSDRAPIPPYEFRKKQKRN